jgi:hypothetical protein
LRNLFVSDKRLEIAVLMIFFGQCEIFSYFYTRNMADELNPTSVRRKALALAAVGMVFGGIALYCAASGEMRGKTFAINTHDRHALFVPVSRADAPADFRHANNLLWAMCVISFGIGAAGIWHYRDLRDCDG